jgi:outer membrane protein assembly factor BamA
MLICFLSVSSFAQKQCRLNIQSADNNTEAINELKIPSTFASKNKCIAYVQQLPALLMTKGYISASLDSVWEDSLSVSAILFTGQKYIWDSLHVGEDDWPVLNQLGFYKSSFNTKPFDQQKVNAVYESLLDYYASSGYPFAKVSLENIMISNNAITANLSIDKGLTYYIDTIQVYGEIKLSKNFITHYLEIIFPC